MFNGNKIRVIASKKVKKNNNKIIKPKLFGFSIKISFYIYWQFRNVFFRARDYTLKCYFCHFFFNHKVLNGNNWFLLYKIEFD